MKTWLITGVIILIRFYSYSQSVNDLKIKRENTVKEIEYTTRLLNVVEENRKVSLNQLQLLNSKIDQRNELISILMNEIQVYQEFISDNELAIRLLQSDLKKIKDEYAEMIRSAYKNINTADQLAFIFSADDFNQAYQRYLYLKKYTTYRKSQLQIMESLEVLFDQKSTSR